MKTIDVSALSVGTLAGSTVAIVPDGGELQHVIASAVAATTVYLVNALFAYLGRRFRK